MHTRHHGGVLTHLGATAKKRSAPCSAPSLKLVINSRNLPAHARAYRPKVATNSTLRLERTIAREEAPGAILGPEPEAQAA